jgi:hypothetical protein
MNPDEFMMLAQRLAATSGEAERRSAISRAYYGLFHAARMIVANCEVVTPESAEAHSKICMCLQSSGHAPLLSAGQKLSSFRNIRNRADYQLSDRRFTSSAFVAVQMSIAHEIDEAIRVARTQVPTFRTAIRRYAKDILKLTVRGSD